MSQHVLKYNKNALQSIEKHEFIHIGGSFYDHPTKKLYCNIRLPCVTCSIARFYNEHLKNAVLTEQLQDGVDFYFLSIL